MHLFLMGLDCDAALFDDTLADRLQGPIGDDLPTPGLTLFDKALGLPVRCRICGRADRWLPDGRVYVCEHEPHWLTPWLRVIDDVSVSKVIVRRNEQAR